MEGEPKAAEPKRPPLRELLRRAGANEVIEVSEKELFEMVESGIAGAVQDHARLRTQARQDAMIVVARARERAGLPATHYSPIDADTAHVITELLLRIQEQRIGEMDDAFARRDQEVARAARTAADFDAAMRGANPPPPEAGPQGLAEDMPAAAQ